MSSYVFGKKLPLDFESAVEAATRALATEGFGVLTEIDVAATLKKKLQLDIPPYKILGACNPEFASQALAIEPQIGALLPCNVVVRQDRDGTIVEFMDPDAVLGLVQEPKIGAIAAEVRARLERVMDAL